MKHLEDPRAAGTPPAAEVGNPTGKAVLAEVAPTCTPLAGLVRGPVGGQTFGQEQPGASATGNERSLAVAATQERGADGPAEAGAPSKVAAARTGRLWITVLLLGLAVLVIWFVLPDRVVIPDRAVEGVWYKILAAYNEHRDALKATTTLAILGYLGQQIVEYRVKKELKEHEHQLSLAAKREEEAEKRITNSMQTRLSHQLNLIAKYEEESERRMSSALQTMVSHELALVAKREEEADKRITNSLQSLWAKELEEVKAKIGENVQTRLKVAEKRLPAYEKLWKLTQEVSPTASGALTQEKRQKLDEQFRQIYYQEYVGIMLSKDTGQKYFVAIEALRGNEPDDVVRKRFSEMRTQMKVDLSIYTGLEAAAPITPAESKRTQQLT